MGVGLIPILHCVQQSLWCGMGLLLAVTVVEVSVSVIEVGGA